MRHEPLDHQISRALRTAAQQVPVRDPLAEIQAAAATTSPRRWRFTRAPALAAVAAFAVGIALVGGVMLVLRSTSSEPSQPAVAGVTTSTEPPIVSTPGPSTATTMPVDEAVGGDPQGFVEVEEALARARLRWQDAGLEEYGYRLDVDCDCAEAGSSRVRVFEGDLPTVDVLFDRIFAAMEQQPHRIAVAFSAADGHPVSYQVTTATGEVAVAIADFHPITQAPTPFDGSWRFVAGAVDGETFQSPANRGLSLTLSMGRSHYPSDCNTVSQRVDIHGGSFGAGPGVTTAAGCGTYSTESALFGEAFIRSDSIRLEGGDLILDGTGVELRFAPPAAPDVLGELALTAAGERLSFEVPDGRERTDQYLITLSLEDPARKVLFILMAETLGSDTPASWQPWAGEPAEQAARVTGSGPDTVVIPDGIGDGDYALCSTYWEPDQFCFILRVRPPSAPWIVTAGQTGAVLHDADGTSATLSTEASKIAFHVAGRLILQPEEQSERIMVVDLAGNTATTQLRTGEVLLDVAQLDGRTRALTSDSFATSIIDIDSGDRVSIAPAAIEARFVGALIVMRTSANSLRAIDRDGTVMWERPIDSETIVVPDQSSHIRLDTFGVLNTDAGFDPFFQYLATELVDLTTGETIDTYEFEIAIPDAGHQIAARCLRAEIQDTLLLCPQPDGRVVTLQVEGGDSRTLTSGATAATYVRMTP